MKRIIFLSLMLMGSLGAEDREQQSILHVNGTGKVLIKATLADIRLGVEVEGKKSIEVQNTLSENLNKLTAALKKASLLKLETSSFTVHPEYSDQAPRTIKGYRGDGEISITVPSERASEIVGLAMDAGATKVNGIDLKASPEAVVEANNAAIKEAALQALASAEAAFDALGLEKDEIVDVNLNPREPSLYPLRASMAFNAMEKGSVGPQVEGEQVVQSDVSLQIRFKTR